MVRIREAVDADREAVWKILHAVVAPGDTYTCAPGISREDARTYWFHPSHRRYVAEREREVVGTYMLKANQPALG